MEGDVLFERSLDDVTDMITHAKLIESDLKPLSQIIRYLFPVSYGYFVTLIVILNFSFNTDMVGEEVKLLEVTKDLAKSFEAGETLTIRGEDAENAVLCSRDKTFEVKEAETSNSLLLLDRIVLPGQVDTAASARSLGWSSVGGVFHKYLEIVEVRPKLRKLKEVLSRNLYTEDSRRDKTRGKPKLGWN